MLDIKTAHSEQLRSLCATTLQTIENSLNDEKIPVKEKLADSFKVLQLGQVVPDEIGSTDPFKLALEEKLRM